MSHNFRTIWVFVKRCEMWTVSRGLGVCKVSLAVVFPMVSVVFRLYAHHCKQNKRNIYFWTVGNGQEVIKSWPQLRAGGCWEGLMSFTVQIISAEAMWSWFLCYIDKTVFKVELEKQRTCTCFFIWQKESKSSTTPFKWANTSEQWAGWRWQISFSDR